MKLRTVIYAILLTTLCVGCGGHGYMRQLERLEAQLDTAPEVVRFALDSIPPRYAQWRGTGTLCHTTHAGRL